ncbi:hypothetical protein Tco_0122644 [Tanacetum coccineum]
MNEETMMREGLHTGSNQGRFNKEKKTRSAASGSAQPPSKDDHQSSKKPRESDASASKQHPSLTSTGWQITDTRDDVVKLSVHMLLTTSRSLTQRALKESKKMSKRQPGTGGSNEGTGSDEKANSFSGKRGVTAPVQISLGHAPSLMTPGYISSGLGKISYYNLPPRTISPVPVAIVASRAVDPVGSPSSTTNDQDEQSTITSQTITGNSISSHSSGDERINSWTTKHSRIFLLKILNLRRTRNDRVNYELDAKQGLVGNLKSS